MKVVLCYLLLSIASANAQNWTQRTPATNPPVRAGHSIAYDAARGQVVLFGGQNNVVSYMSDTWIWDGVNWTQKFPAHVPPARWLSTLVYDSLHEQVVLFGGANTDFLNDTWVWNGFDWQKQTPRASPSARDQYQIAYDEVNKRVVLFGGYSDLGILHDTWTWDGSNWQQHFPSEIPPANAQNPMVWDSTDRYVLLYADALTTEVANQTWAWTGADWMSKTTISGPDWPGSGGADDPAHNQVVLFGGRDFESATYVWNGSTWNEAFPSAVPVGREAFGFTFDRARGEAVMFGGFAGGAWLNDTWVWSQYPLTNSPLKGTSGINDSKLNPYTTQIFTALDHSMTDSQGKYHIYGHDGTVTAFTSEFGTCSTTKQPPACPAKRDGYENASGTSFGVTGHYTGASSDGGTAKLQYEGHPGFDFDASCQKDATGKCKLRTGTNVYAVATGTISYPASMVGLGEATSQYNVLELAPDGVPYLHIYYLHLSTYKNTSPFTVTDPSPAPGCPSVVTLPLNEGQPTHVNAGCLIAQSGNTAPPPGVGPHLHLEVQRSIPFVNLPSTTPLGCSVGGTTMTCLPVDPYGFSCGT